MKAMRTPLPSLYLEFRKVPQPNLLFLGNEKPNAIQRDPTNFIIERPTTGFSHGAIRPIHNPSYVDMEVCTWRSR